MYHVHRFNCRMAAQNAKSALGCGETSLCKQPSDAGQRVVENLRKNLGNALAALKEKCTSLKQVIQQGKGLATTAGGTSAQDEWVNGR